MRGKLIILSLALFTIVGFSAGGIAIIEYAQGISYREAFKTKTNLALELSVGIAYGFLAAFLAWQLIQSELMKPVQEKYGNLIGSLKLNIPEIIFISLCAGIGEEVLFRGGIQPYLGVWLTSVVFVALHGYLSPFDWRISVYGGLMTLIIVGIGYMFDHLGITASMAAHTVIDIVLLYLLTFKVPPPEKEVYLFEGENENEREREEENKWEFEDANQPEDKTEFNSEDSPSTPTTPEL